MSQSQYRGDASAFHEMNRATIRGLQGAKTLSVIKDIYGHDHHPLTGNRETKYQQFPDMWIFFPKAGPVYFEHSRSASFMIDFAAEFWKDKLIIRLNVFHLDQVQQMLRELLAADAMLPPILYIWNTVLEPAYWMVHRQQGMRILHDNGTEQWQLIMRRYPKGISK
jgi:hypothetical protein